MRRDFVANVSHELKTPVTVLSGFVETLSDESFPMSQAQRGRYLAMMAEQAKRMQRLVEDLLTLSALESSAAPAEERPIELLPLSSASRTKRARCPPGGIASRARSKATAGSSAAPPSCTARSRTWYRTPCATRPAAAASASPGESSTAAACFR